MPSTTGNVVSTQQFKAGAGVYRGRRDIAKFAFYREISRNSAISAINRELHKLSRNFVKKRFFREISPKFKAQVLAEGVFQNVRKCFIMSKPALPDWIT